MKSPLYASLSGRFASSEKPERSSPTVFKPKSAAGSAGEGLLVVFVVEDIDGEYARLQGEGVPIGQPREFDLPDRYDAVICMFSSIGYVKTLPELERTLRTFRRHMAPNGVLIVEPWFSPEVMKEGSHSVRSAMANGIKVERTGTIAIEGRMTHLRFDYVIEEGDTTRRTSEIHELGLFTIDETLRAFSAAGLAAEHHAPSATNRGLYVARLSP